MCLPGRHLHGFEMADDRLAALITKNRRGVSREQQSTRTHQLERSCHTHKSIMHWRLLSQYNETVSGQHMVWDERCSCATFSPQLDAQVFGRSAL